MIRRKVKDLWKLCFNDSEEFVNMYFRLRYSNDVNIAIRSGGEVIAALQMIPYPMSFGETEISTAYISGACTHPEYRNRGVMHQLLSQAFIRMLHDDVALSTLIPAEPWLFDYYARSGYAPVFTYSERIFTASGMRLPKGDFTLKTTHKYSQEIYEYVNRKLKERPYCIQHTVRDFQVILSDLRISEGHIFRLNRGQNMAALAFAYPEEANRWYIGELVSDTPEVGSILLQCICEHLNVPSVKVIAPPVAGEGNHPLGMARIINAQTILARYAATHPEVILSIHLTDGQISGNNGYYYLNNGKCTNSAKRLPGKHLALTIGELTGKIYSPLNPYMSLMLS